MEKWHKMRFRLFFIFLFFLEVFVFVFVFVFISYVCHACYDGLSPKGLCFLAPTDCSALFSGGTALQNNAFVSFNVTVDLPF